MSAKTDVVASLLIASKRCNNDSLMIIENEEVLISNEVLNIINTVFSKKGDKDTKHGLELAWSNSLYKNGKLGFSVAYPNATETNKSYRKHPLEPMKSIFLKIPY